MFDSIPAGASLLLTQLAEAGYKGYLVGGCVRDALLGIVPHDWDICTNALPGEMQQVFRSFHTVETGLKHGTLTVVVNHEPFEITTFRTDGVYTDHRHPDGVEFVQDVVLDLARRDFTVNAMAWNPEDGLIDPFHGQEDLAAGLIRCVGCPEERFTEDALRIVRALRFSSVYAFPIEKQTAEAASRLAGTLQYVAAERIRTELGKTLCGRDAGRILREHSDILSVILPEILPCIGFDQHTPHHRYDVWEHSILAVENIAPVEALRLTMLLHDIGKPASFTLDEEGIGHAYGHQGLSAGMADRILERLKYDRNTQDRVVTLVRAHDMDISESPSLICRRLNQFGEENYRALLLVQRADALGKGTADPGEIEDRYQRLLSSLEAVLADRRCFTLKDLSINGRDLSALGFRGKQIGLVLQRLLEAVMDESLKNDHDTLLQAASVMFSSYL